jgi:hypothetical protein
MTLAKLNPMLFALMPFAACEDTHLPDMTIPLSENTRIGIDLLQPHPTLGISITDPLHRMPR